MSSQPRRVVMVHNSRLYSLCSKIPNIRNRVRENEGLLRRIKAEITCQVTTYCSQATVVYSLLEAYKLLNHLRVIDIIPATEEDLCKFHSKLYVDFVQSISEKYSKASEDDKNLIEDSFFKECEEFGIGYDCPLVDGLSELVSVVGGSSITAAKQICDGKADIAINWYGGWHHAQRDNAEGFCYVNDVVLAIEELRTRFNNVLYIDLDVHHGNGVENAYNFSSKVFTISLHQMESGFYPGTGELNDIGIGSGKYYTVNIPLREGISDDSYCYVFKRCVSEIVKHYKPDVVVVQCGADGLVGDKIGAFNLTLSSYGYCIKQILSWRKPTIFLGGGGYNVPNVARCWVYITSIITGQLISDFIPDNKYFQLFGPDFSLSISPSNRKDNNTTEYLDNIVETIIGRVQHKFSNSQNVETV